MLFFFPSKSSFFLWEENVYCVSFIFSPISEVWKLSITNHRSWRIATHTLGILTVSALSWFSCSRHSHYLNAQGHHATWGLRSLKVGCKQTRDLVAGTLFPFNWDNRISWCRDCALSVSWEITSTFELISTLVVIRVYCILASCYIRLTLNICSFVRQCNIFTSWILLRHVSASHGHPQLL
jgi:hypothetical protein